jgi:D-sedoheptulose 7-phosphate isomerase
MHSSVYCGSLRCLERLGGNYKVDVPGNFRHLIAAFTFMESLAQQLEALRTTVENFRSQLPAVEITGKKLAATLAGGGRILTCGNGGSACDALHLSEELVGRFDQNRRSLAAICLSADAPLLTCIANDFGYDAVFARQVEGLGRPGDALIVFSTSGNSMNLVAALQAARKNGLATISLLGKNGGKCLGLADHDIIIPSSTTARIQELHTFILHGWLGLIELELGLNQPPAAAAR